MPVQTNTNVSPYYDDFDAESNFHRVLFKPGYPVQARELTQSQTILQDQIEKLSNSFLKDGDNVVPGSFTFTNVTPYVRCSSITQGAKAEEFVGFRLRGVSSGVVADVDFALDRTDEDDVTFYVTYLDSGDDSETPTFFEGEILESDTPNNYTATVGLNEVSRPIVTPPIGLGSVFAIDEGYYFVNGFIVRNDSQTIAVDKYGTTPTCKIGFLVDEDFINSNEDPSLLDNSQGNTNFAAPGADRLKISLILAKRDIDSFDPNFITLVTIINGQIIGSPLNSNKNDWWTDILAKRTFDESGNYIVTEFPIKPLEYVNSEFVEGVADPNEDGTYPSPNVFDVDVKLTYDQADSLYAIKVSPGNAYVQGYNVQFVNPFNIYGDKARDLGFVPNTYTQINPGYRVDITNVSSTPDFQNNRGTVSTNAFSPVICYRNFNDGFTGSSLTLGDETTYPVTERRPVNNGNAPWKTYHIITDSSVGSFGDLEIEDGYYKVTIKHNRSNKISEAILIYPDQSSITLNPDADLSNISIGNSLVLRLLPDVFGTDNDEPLIRGDEIGVGAGPAYNSTTLVSFPFQPLKTGIVYPKYLQNDDLIESDSSVYGFNSTFKMGVLDAHFFEDLLVVDDPLTQNEEWELGNFVLGETSRAEAKLEDAYGGNLVLSNITGTFKNGETVRQNLRNGVTNTYSTYVPTPNSNTGLSAQQFTASGVVTDDVNGIYKFNVTYSSAEQLSGYVGGGYVTKVVGNVSQNANVINAVYDGVSTIGITIDSNIGINLNDTVTVSEMIFSAVSQNAAASVKRGKVVRRGEVAKFYFDDYIGNTNPPDQTPGGGVDTVIFTPDVQLISPSSLKGLRLPPESGLTTQADANEWFYYSIKSLLSGEGSSQIFIDENEPAEKSFGDLWIEPVHYSMATWDGLYWIDIVAGSETDEYNTNAVGDGSDTQAVIAEYVENNVNAHKVRQLAKQVLLQRADSFDVPDPMLVPANYDLASVQYVDVFAIGSTLRLYTLASPDVNTGPGGQVQPDIFYDYSHNSIELTDRGRDRVYNFPFFDSALTGSKTIPRINYRLKTDTGVNGFALTFPAVIENNFKNVKSFFCDNVDATAENFTADISTQSKNNTDIFTIADRASFSGSSGRNYIVCDNFDGDPSQELTAGDLISLTNDQGIVENKIVYSATEPYGYGTTKTKSVIYFTTTLIANVTSKQLQRVRIKSVVPPTDGNIIRLQENVIKTIETDQNITNIDYEVYRQFVGTIDEGDDEIIITTSASNEVIVTDLNKTSIFIVGMESPSVDFDSVAQRSLIGRPLIVKDTTLAGEGKQLTLKLKEPASSRYRVKVIVAVRVTNAKARKKELREKVLIVKYDASNPFDPVSSPASQSVISLEKADVFKIKSITTMDGANNVIDISDDYMFDDGQTEDLYGISLLRRNVDAPIPSSDVTVTFDYFKHDSLVGGFFSVDSYVHNTGVLFGDIPTFTPSKKPVNSINGENNLSETIQLRDCVDFRPIVNTDSTTGSTLPSLNLTDPTDKLVNYLNPKVSGDGFVPAMPVPGTQFKCDIENYLPKIDSIFLDKSGKVVILTGISSTNPVAPADLATGIRLYDIAVPAYTFKVSQLNIRKYNYRRYTMSDIFDIDRRVDRVEDLVSLTLLETAALSTEVRDSVTGLGRFKNGVIVDPFRDHFKGDVGNVQYRASIDPTETHLRPPYVLDQVELEERYDTDEARLDLGGYVNNSGIATLPYNEVNFVSSNFATKFVNLQPYSVFTYEGKLTLDPPIDTFRDVTTLPQLIIEDNSIYNAMEEQAERLNVLGVGTVWGAWETQRVQNISRSLGAARGNGGNLFFTQNTQIVGQSRTITRPVRSVSTGSITSTSYGDRVVDMQVAETMRAFPVFFIAERLKPNTRYYAFFDSVDVSEWVSTDQMVDTFPDGKRRYTGVPNTNPAGFGTPIISDANGNINGVFLIPNGRSPELGSVFDGNLLNVEYKTSGPTRSFNTGQRSLRFTSSSDNNSDVTQLEGFCQSDFVSSGVLLDKQETIVATRIPEVTTSFIVREEGRTLRSSSISTRFVADPPPPPRPVPDDPIAQTFFVDKTHDEGVFVSDIDIFFKTKDPVQGVEVYLVATDGGFPSPKILPHSKVIKSPDTILRVLCDLNGLNTATLEAGVTVVGVQSGAVGVVSSNVKFTSGSSTDATPNVNNTVYDVILSNYLNEFIPGEAIIPQISPTSQASYTIAHNEVRINRCDLKTMGNNYPADARIEFTAPDLPGGVRAEASIKVSDIITPSTDGKPYPNGRLGQIYKVELTNPGSGYIKKPSMSVISSTGSGATFEARVSHGRVGAYMGVATSDDATAPTKFKFGAPVYLLSNQSYAFVVKCPTSLKYRMWIAKLGQNIIGTNTRMTQQPNLGSIYRSGNNSVWTEDQTEDVMFNLRRCEFLTNTEVNVPVQNVPLPMSVLPNNPIQVSRSVSGGLDDNVIFGANHKVVRIFAPNHGLSPTDSVNIENVNGVIDGNDVENVGGMPVDDINGFHEVIESDIDYFTILVKTNTTNDDIVTVRGGGNYVKCSTNSAYETINLYSGVITFKNTSVLTYNRATDHAGASLYNVDNAYVINNETIIPIMDSYYYNGAKQVASEINEAKYKAEEYLNKGKSLRTRFVMESQDSEITPVLDVTRTNMNIIRNQVDSPEYKSRLVFGYITVPLTLDATFASTVSISDIIHTDDTSVQIVEHLQGNDFEVTGTREAVDNFINSSKVITRNSIDPTVSQVTSFPVFPETSSEGTTYAKWISRKFVLENSCDGIELKLSAILYEKNDIRVYYSAKNIGTQDDSIVNWIPFNQTASTEGVPDNIETITPRSTVNIDPREINADEWQTMVWSEQDISRFDSISIKIVMTAKNPARTPVIDDMRLICTE